MTMEREDSARTCAEEGCERASCRPAEYEPLCAKHYLASVRRAHAAAEARFQARIRALTEERQ